MAETTIEIKQIVTPHGNCIEQLFVHYRQNSNNLQGANAEMMSSAIEENIRLFLMVMDAFIEGTTPKFPERKFLIQTPDDKPDKPIISIWSGRYAGKTDQFMIQWDNKPDMIESARITSVMYNDTDPNMLLNAMRGLLWGLDRYVESNENGEAIEGDESQPVATNKPTQIADGGENDEVEAVEIDSHLALVDAEEGEFFRMSVGAIRISKDGKTFKIFGFNDLAEKEVVAVSDMNYIGVHVDKESDSGEIVTRTIGEKYLVAGKSYRGKWSLTAEITERHEKHLIINIIELN